MSGFKVPFIKPSFPSSAEIAGDFDEIVDANWYTNFGPKEKQFRRALLNYLGQDLAVATFANGSLALLAAIYCTFGRGNSDKYLLMPSFTFAAVPQAAIWSGYRPWFIDINPTTWQVDPEAGRQVIESHRDEIAGLLLPNAAGVGSPHIAEWERLAAEWDLSVVIDSAAGFGSRYPDGSLLGARGSCEIFSFHATKPFAVGEGGALASHNNLAIEAVLKFQNFGFDSHRMCVDLGINGKLSEINAAIGLRQLLGLDARLASRRETFERYRAEFGPMGIRFQPNAESSAHQAAALLCASPMQKQSVLQSLLDHSVEARDYYNPALHRHPYFLTNPDLSRVSHLATTDEVCSRIVSLPVHEYMSASDLDLVIQAVKRGLSG